MDFTGPSQKNSSSSVSLLQSRALTLHNFILKVPCFLQFFVRPKMKTILFQDHFHPLFYHDRVKKTVLLTFKPAFFKTHKCLFYHKFRPSLHIFWNWLDVYNYWKSLQHAPTQDRDYFTKHWIWGFGCTLKGWFKFTSFHLKPSNGWKLMCLSGLFLMGYLPQIYL